MADIIATREDCNGIKSGSFSSNLKRCVTRAEVENVGLAVSGWTGASNQLVPYKYIYYPISYVLTITPSSTWNGEVGDSRQYEATLYTYRGSTQIASESVTTKVTWSAGNSRVSINSSGYATINSSGSTTITATYSSYGVSDFVIVSAINKVRQYLTVSPSSTSVYIGNTVTFSATLETVTNGVPSYNYNPSVTWSTSNGKANINSYGTVTGVTSGNTTITATLKSDSNVYDTATLTVIETSYGLSVSPTSWNGTYGDTKKFSATGYTYENGTVVSTNTNPSVSWSSTNTSIVTIDSSGNAKAVGGGTANIKCTWNGITKSISVSLNNLTTRSLYIDPSSIELDYGDSYVLRAYMITTTNGSSSTSQVSVTWKSSNTNVATINSSGVVTAGPEGTATITATYSTYNLTATASVRTYNVVTRTLTLEPSSTTCYVGDKPSFTAYLTTTTNGVADFPVAQSSTNITWSSSDTNVATVLNGALTTKKSGTITITGKSKTYTSLSATASVTVQDKVSYYYSVVPSSWNAEVGDTTSFMAYLVTVTNGVESVATSPSSVSWLTSNGNVVTVNSTGYATAQGEGNAEITASKGGVTGTATVTVSKAADVIRYELLINPTSWSGKLGQSQQFQLTYKKYVNNVVSTADTIVVTSASTWTLSPSSLGSVSKGNVTLSGEGSGTVTASYNGYTASANITSENYSISVSPSSFSNVLASGGTATVTVTTNDSWSVSSCPSWVTLSKSSGSAGSTNVIGTITSNTTSSIRTGSITFTCGTETATVSISQQKPAVDTISVSPTSFPNVPALGGRAVVTVTCAGGWTILSAPSWISANITNGSGNTTVRGTIAENTNTLQRSGTITFKASNGGAIASVSVVQKGAETPKLINISFDSTSYSALRNASSIYSVYANYSDGTQQNITDRVAITQKSGTKGVVTSMSGGVIQHGYMAGNATYQALWIYNSAEYVAITTIYTT